MLSQSVMNWLSEGLAYMDITGSLLEARTLAPPDLLNQIHTAQMLGVRVRVPG